MDKRLGAEETPDDVLWGRLDGSPKVLDSSVEST